MATAIARNKKGVLLFVVVVIAISLIMIVANYRSDVFDELIPPPGGLKRLFTSANQLVAVSRKDHIYIWDWNNLPAEPRKGIVKVQDVTVLDSGRLLWISPQRANTLVIGDLKDQKEYKRILLDWGWWCRILRTSRNGKFVAVGLVDKMAGKDKTDSYKRIRIGIFDSELEEVKPVITISGIGDDFALRNIAVSEDGAFVTVVGNNNGAWIAVADVKKKTILWHKVIEGITRLDEVTFSSNGKIVYVAGYSKIVYGLEIPDGNILYRLDIGPNVYGPIGGEVKNITTLTASPDSELVASAGYCSFLRVWEAESGKAVCKLNHGQRSNLSGMAFSQDSSQLATIGVQPTTKIKVWQVSKIADL